MRDWIAPKNPTYEVKGKIIVTDGAFKEKLSGTTMGAMMGLNSYMSPFAASTKLLGLWNEDISDKPAIVTGKMLEERIIDYLSSKHSDVGLFLKAEDLDLGVREGDHADWKSDFEDDVYSGHLDGIISKDGKDYILEIKTANRRQIEEKGTWIDGNIPKQYLWQVYLYNHFITHQDKAYFGLGIVDSKTYENPNLWVATKSNCKLFEISIDQKMVAEKVEEIRQLYLDTVGAGISTEYDPTNEDDVDIRQHLIDISSGLPELMQLVQEYAELKKSNKAHTDLIKDSLAKEKKLGDRIKDTMLSWEMGNCGIANVTHQHKQEFDFKQATIDGFDFMKYLKEAEKDGYDLSKYVKTKTTNVLKLKE